MINFTRFFLILIAFTFIEAGISAEYADARSRGGGRSFGKSFSKRPAAKQSSMFGNKRNKQTGGFGRGLAGGLLGGALGGMLFGSMMGGSGMGLLPILILGFIGFWLFRRMSGQSGRRPNQFSQPPPYNNAPNADQFSNTESGKTEEMGLEDGLAQIRANDRDFDPAYFVSIASDVFFKIQAGWMRRDLKSYEDLLGRQLASEYEKHFSEMIRLGHLNKLESIAVRDVKIVDAGSDGEEDFITVLFTASLLDYTVDDKTGTLIDGSMTEPVKFKEKWTWARPVGSQDWKLEGIDV